MNAHIGEHISVCLLTYNHVEVIESTLASILDQTIKGYEVIVSDDCSTDGTWEKIQMLAAKDTRIKPVQTSGNTGMPGNANFAVANSTRPYIALLHHDDIYRNDLLEKWVELVEEYPDIAFVFNPYGVHDSEYVFAENIPSGRLEGSWLLDHYLLPRWGCAVRGTAMIRRSSWEQAGGMREQFGLLSDVDLWMRLSMRWAVGYVAEPIIMIRHQRPSYYPDIYKSNSWSWPRQRYLYEIHAQNRKKLYKGAGLSGSYRWWLFRTRLSVETAKWLCYAIVKRKWYIIETSPDSITLYDQAWLRLFRRLICFYTRRFVTNNADS